VTPPLSFAGSVHRVRFSPDGRLVMALGRGRYARIWGAADGEAVALVRRDAKWVVAAIANAASEAPWDLPTDDRPVDDLVTLSQWLSGHRVDATGGLVPLDPAALRRAGEKFTDPTGRR
jgi:hypothetical protein